MVAVGEVRGNINFVRVAGFFFCDFRSEEAWRCFLRIFLPT